MTPLHVAIVALAILMLTAAAIMHEDHLGEVGYRCKPDGTCLHHLTCVYSSWDGDHCVPGEAKPCVETVSP